jgi:hypothetical protein
MGWLDIFGKKEKKRGPDPLKDLTLPKIQVGYFVDFDMKTWEVTAYNQYTWGEGDISHEWQLKSHDDTLFLARESDDEDYWGISRPIPFARLGPDIRKHILDYQDPPDEIVFDGITYHLEEFGGGHFFKDGQGPGQEFLSWDYEDEEGEKYLSIEQWGEDDFEASVGEPVEEYQFSNILPRELPQE